MDHLSPALKIEHVKASELKANEYNPKKFSESQISQIEESIRRFGFVDPLICNGATQRKNILIGGHGRLQVAKRLKMKTVPVVYIDIPDIDKEKELNIRLHKNQGEFDLGLLGEFDSSLLADIGFDNTELEDIFSDIDTSDDVFDVKEELGKIKKPSSKIGDLYQLGKHRLYCGDSTKPESIQKVVGNEMVDMVYCDPVYNINLSYKSGVGGTKNYGGSAQDKKTETEYKSFLSKTVENALSVCNNDAHIFYYCDETYVPMVAEIYKEHGVDFKRICLWLKGVVNPVPQVAFSKVYEPCVYGTIGKPYLSKNHTNYDEVLNKDIGTGSAMIENFLELINVWAVQRLGGNAYEHPTEKPITLHDKPIKRCTKIGGTILSLFGGSGGELMAAQQLNRRCFMVEMDPVFVDLIIRRFEKLTGEKAIKIDSHEV